MTGFAIIAIGAAFVATSDVAVGEAGAALMSIGFGLAIVSLNRRGFQTTRTAPAAARLFFGFRNTVGAVFGGLLILFGLVILAQVTRLI